MKHCNLAVILMLGVLLLLQVLPLSAAQTENKTVILKVHVPFAGG